jgi:hypothetical protein
MRPKKWVNSAVLKTSFCISLKYHKHCSESSIHFSIFFSGSAEECVAVEKLGAEGGGVNTAGHRVVPVVLKY